MLLVFIGMSACVKETIDKPNGERLLREIRMNNKVYQRFIYEQSQLTTEQYFGSVCTENPVDVFGYVYQQGQLISLQTTLRSIYSSTSSMCNPDLGIKSEDRFEYDVQGRLIKTIREASYTSYVYNNRGLVEKQTVHFPGSTSVGTTSFRYDSRGNITEMEDSDGSVTQYEYDNKPNPFYLINHRPGWISAFNRSPNNVINASGKHTFERSINYHTDGLPKQVLESNGIYYTYYYK
jgi:YD repeat-containing protein